MAAYKDIEDLGLKIQDEVKSAVVRPGDTVVICFERRLNQEEYHTLIDWCNAAMPDVKVLALPEVKDIRVFRPSEPEGM